MEYIYIYRFMCFYVQIKSHSTLTRHINSYINYLFLCCCARDSCSPCIQLLQERGNESIFYIGLTHTHVHACIYNSRYTSSMYIAPSPPFFSLALVFLSCWPNIRSSQENLLSIQQQISADLTASPLRRSGFGGICLNVCVLWEKHGVKGLGKGEDFRSTKYYMPLILTCFGAATKHLRTVCACVFVCPPATEGEHFLTLITSQ